MSGVDAGKFIGEELAGAPDAGLHLVEDQQQAMPVADLAQAAQEIARSIDAHAALALDRLDHDRGGLRPDRRLDRGQIGDRNLVEALHLRSEAFEIFRLPAGRERRQRAAVEGALEGQDVEALGMAGRPPAACAPS